MAYQGRELKKSRKFVSELYIETTSYDIGKVIDNVVNKFPVYAYCLHDKDTYTVNDTDDESKIGQYKKDHIHVVMETSSPMQLGYVAKLLEVPSNFVQICDNKIGAYQYLVHKHNPEKYQYNPSEVVTNIENFQKKYLTDNDGAMKAKIIIDHIQEVQSYLTLTELSVWTVQNYVWDEFRRGQHLFTAILNEHNLMYRKD